jgi:ubiquitin C-terminal hydrolase
MFGLRNFSGSCWVNACLQSLFRIPNLQLNKENPIESCIQQILTSEGKEGLKEFFESVRTATMPAGQNIGDSHELLVHLCDKIKWLDDSFRFKVAETTKCQHCEYSETNETSWIELSLQPKQRGIPLPNAIGEVVTPYEISDWKCEKCSNLGCRKEMKVGSFPKLLMFHITSLGGSIKYSSVVVVNGRKYALLSILCFNGGHWWAFSREMPPGKPWYTLNDTHVTKHHPAQFPLADTARVLIYYRLDE